MEIILKENVQGLGFKNEIVTVKDGYGRNFLSQPFSVAEQFSGIPGIYVPVATTEWQFFTKSSLVDLDDLHACSFKVKNFILDSKSDLKSRILDRDVFTWE